MALSWGAFWKLVTKEGDVTIIYMQFSVDPTMHDDPELWPVLNKSIIPGSGSRQKKLSCNAFFGRRSENPRLGECRPLRTCSL